MTDTSKDAMKVLQIDDKWSVHYDPKNNDSPMAVFRHGERHPVGPVTWNNDSIAMFYELLDAREKIAALSAQIEAANARASRARDDALVEAWDCIGHTTQSEDRDAIQALRTQRPASVEPVTVQEAARVQALEVGLGNCLSIIDALVKESGREVEYGEEDAFRNGEWFEPEDMHLVESARAALRAIAGEKND